VARVVDGAALSQRRQNDRPGDHHQGLALGARLHRKFERGERAAAVVLIAARGDVSQDMRRHDAAHRV